MAFGGLLVDYSSRRTCCRAPGEVCIGNPTKVHFSALLGNYRDNEVSADATDFKSQFIEVTGVVAEVKNDLLNKPYVIVGTGKQFEVPAVQCSLATSAVERAAMLHKGDTVTVRGTVAGLFLNVQLQECEIH